MKMQFKIVKDSVQKRAMLSAGAYHYSLVVDGRMISSKQMILTK
jgi:hypothetical protein